MKRESFRKTTAAVPLGQVARTRSPDLVTMEWTGAGLLFVPVDQDLGNPSARPSGVAFTSHQGTISFIGASS